ncbi:DNA alkylation repair protein [Thermophagus xiamenensis]|uniref:DNA alkylation repair enzyme n=1 Tax=Thermophagus xiamenensis TaxID=385682 RepID=A0A1I1UM89_9BACT|nr:DNA alkylation repair protein [Thermophagus xiamenensis]SFD71867.1 DNA alkylation repair enzyme [Thermophagus xiamenensis]
MKFFPQNEKIELQIDDLLRKIRHLKNGETSELMSKSGVNYKLNFGVSIIHLRKLAESVEPSNDLAQRLWYRGIRETMIIATMVADVETLDLQELEEWGRMLNTIELAEQMGRNLLAKATLSETVLIDWTRKENLFQCYASVMAIGWRLRFNGSSGFKQLEAILPVFRELIKEKVMFRAVSFAMKMAGRFCDDYLDLVKKTIDEWLNNGIENERIVAKEVRAELDAFGLL